MRTPSYLILGAVFAAAACVALAGPLPPPPVRPRVRPRKPGNGSNFVASRMPSHICSGHSRIRHAVRRSWASAQPALQNLRIFALR